MPKLEKIVGYLELVFAAMAGFVCASSFKTAFFPSDNTHWEAPGWALMIFILITPLALSFGISGFALIKSFRRKWLFHIFPIFAVIAISIFFWWADVGSVKY